MSHYDEPNVVLRFFSLFTTRTLLSFIALVIVTSIFALIHTQTIAFFRVPTSSMEPTFIPGDQLIVFRKSAYQRGDIVVLDDPQEKGAYLLKRLVALGGDTVSISPEGLRINHTLVHEPYLKESITYTYEPYTLPDGQIFVLGDNRNESSDSHLWGHVPVNTLIGQARYIYAPKERTRTLPKNNPAFKTIPPAS